MPTPTAVTSAARSVDDLIRSLSNQQPAEDTGDTPPDDALAQPSELEGDDAVTEEAPSPNEPVASQETQFTHDQPDSAPQAEEQSAPRAADEGDAEHRAQLWEQRYRSLNGMIESRDRQIESLHQLLSNLQDVQKLAPVSAPDSAPAPAITDEDKDEYGEGMIDLARRIAQAELSERESKLMQRIQQLESQVSGVSQAQESSAQERFLTKLRERIPQLDQVNQSPDFIRWLGASPTRQRMFNEAVQAMDLDGTAFFFETWASAQQTQPTTTSAQKPTQKTDQRLARQVAPGKSRSVPTPAQRSEGTKRQWTRSAIVQFYKNLSTYPQQDRERIERDIAQAQKEGRVDFTK